MIGLQRLLHRRLRELSLLVALAALTSACTGGYRLAPSLVPLSDPSFGVTWLTPAATNEVTTLARWRSAVGQPLVTAGVPNPAEHPIDGVTVVSWNIALGAGDVTSLFERIRQEHPRHAVVLLLQEAFRGGDEVPRVLVNSAFARKIRGAEGREVDDVARALGLWLYYVPSMRNGAPGLSDEDRGNAILATIPLENLVAIELPFERQRRVAVAATVRGRTSAGEPWTVRVASAHLDNMAGLNRAFVGGEYGRLRQARGLRDALQGPEPLVLGGDFNTWFGFSDAAYVEMARAFPQTKVTDDRRTFIGLLRLDHVFYRLPASWRASVRRGESALGSDHHPLITTLSFQAFDSAQGKLPQP